MKKARENAKVFVEKNYRECVRLAMQINEKRRAELCDDSLNENTIIYSGLHTSQSKAERALLFEQYLVLWLDKHWNVLLSIINECGLQDHEKTDVQLFYANFMLEKMFPQYKAGSNYSALALHEYFQFMEMCLERLINFAGNQNAKSNRLEIAFKKHEEFYKRKLYEIKK